MSCKLMTTTLKLLDLLRGWEDSGERGTDGHSVLLKINKLPVDSPEQIFINHE